MLKEFYVMKEKIKSVNDKWKFKLYIKAMLFYCFNCRKNMESKNLKVAKIKNRRIMLLSKCAVYESKK